MVIRSYVGGHDVVVYHGAIYDPPAVVIPYAGRMLSAVPKPAQEEQMEVNGVLIPLHKATVWDHVDPLPNPEECDYALVSALFVAACKSLGIDTSRLLTIGGAVVDDAGRTIGCVWLNRN